MLQGMRGNNWESSFVSYCAILEAIQCYLEVELSWLKTNCNWLQTLWQSLKNSKRSIIDMLTGERK